MSFLCGAHGVLCGARGVCHFFVWCARCFVWCARCVPFFCVVPTVRVIFCAVCSSVRTVFSFFCFVVFKNIFAKKKMTKTILSPEDIEQIKQSKGKLPAAEVQRRYNIGWGRLQKMWNDNQEPATRVITRDAQPITMDAEDKFLYKLTPQDLFAKLQQIETNIQQIASNMQQMMSQMDNQSDQIEKQTIRSMYVVDALDTLLEEESDTQSILKQEKKETHTLQDVEKTIQECSNYTSTIVWCAFVGFAVWQAYCTTCKHVEKVKDTFSVPAAPAAPKAEPAVAPTTQAPVQAPVEKKAPQFVWTKKKKDPDPFEME